MTTVAVIQARMGSSRLPGKVMLPLDCDHSLKHVVSRVRQSTEVDKVVVATSDLQRDDIVATYAERFGATVSRGDEADVLGRMLDAARSAQADTVVRVTGDCPLVPSKCVDAVVRRLHSQGVDYASNIVGRTFPRGFDVEAFTMESFEHVGAQSTEPHQREHVTQLYLENPDDEFELANVTSDDVYEETYMQDRSDLRLTLDEAADYELLRTVYESIEFDEILDEREAVAQVEEHDWAQINADVGQKSAR